MASKRGQKRKACTGKQRHATETEAKAALRMLYLAGKADGRMRAYKCQFCSRWHIGHVPARIAQAIDDRRAGARP